MNNQLSLKIPSLLENIRIIESFIDKVKEDFSINDDIYGNILIAVTEAVNNAIIHGNDSNKNKNVHLALKISTNNILFTVEDEGDGFDQDALEDPTDPSALTSDGGRGIYLIKHLADEVKFDKNGKRIRMTFYMM